MYRISDIINYWSVWHLLKYFNHLICWVDWKHCKYITPNIPQKQTKQKSWENMEGSDYGSAHLPSPALVVFSQAANGLGEALRIQRPFHSQVCMVFAVYQTTRNYRHWGEKIYFIKKVLNNVIMFKIFEASCARKYFGKFSTVPNSTQFSEFLHQVFYAQTLVHMQSLCSRCEECDSIQWPRRWVDRRLNDNWM